MPYTLPSNLTTLQQMGGYVNSVTNNVFGYGISIVMLIIIFTTLHRQWGLRVSVGGTGVIFAIMSILWRFTGLTTDFVMFTGIIVGFGSLLFLAFTRDD